MPDIVEVARQIHVDDRGHTPQDTAPDFRQRSVWRPLRPKPVRIRAKVRLEDGFRDQLQRPLHDAIADARNLERANFSVVLRDVDLSVRLRFIPACEEIFSYLRQKCGQACRLNIVKALAIDAGGTPISLGDTIGLQERLRLTNMHEDSSEAMRLIRLRLSIYSPSSSCRLIAAFIISPLPHFELTDYPPGRALPYWRVLLHADPQYYDSIRHPGACVSTSHSRL